jgi:hypothetical protein
VNETNDTSVWEQLDSLPDDQLNALVAAAASVLAEAGDDPAAAETLAMPPGAAARELRAQLDGAGVAVDEAEAERLVSDQAASREVALTVLRELGKEPGLAAEIEEAWRARRGMMVVEGGVLVGAALLLLVMKLKKLSVRREGLDVEFYEAKNDVLAAIKGFLGR